MAQATAQDVTMPRLSDSMEEGTILSWHKRIGEEVAVGEEIAEIETDKANMGYEVALAGTLVEILVGEGETAAARFLAVEVGAGGLGAQSRWREWNRDCRRRHGRR